MEESIGLRLLSKLKLKVKVLETKPPYYEAQHLIEKEKAREALKAGNLESARACAGCAVHMKHQATEYNSLISAIKVLIAKAEGSLDTVSSAKPVKDVMEYLDSSINLDVVTLTAAVETFGENIEEVDVQSTNLKAAINVATDAPDHGVEIEDLLKGLT